MPCHRHTASSVVARRPQGCERSRVSIDGSLLRHPAFSLFDGSWEEDGVILPAEVNHKIEIVLCDSHRKPVT